MFKEIKKFFKKAEVEIVAKAIDIATSTDKGLSTLGPDGRSYIVYYRNNKGKWIPIPLVENFPK